MVDQTQAPLQGAEQAPEIPPAKAVFDPLQSGAALTAAPDDVTGLGLSEKAAAVRAEGAERIKRLQEQRERGFSGAFGVGMRTGTTARIAEAVAENMNALWEDFDPDFDPAAALPEVAREYNFNLNEAATRYIGGSGTEQEMMFRASEYKRHLEAQEILSQHGVAALASGVVDPTWLLADIATFGVTRLGRMGRVASGMTMASGGLGVTAAGDAAGVETTGFDYILNTALMYGAGHLFGGEAARRIASGESNWYGRVSKDHPGSPSNINEFVSEYDRLAMPGRPGDDARAALLGRLADDPVRRQRYMQDVPATSYLRMYRNRTDRLNIAYQDEVEGVLKQQGFGAFSRKVDTSGEYMAARDSLEARVAEEILSRDEHWRVSGTRVVGDNPTINKLADRLEDLHNEMGQIARDAGLRGFEDFVPRPGYFHRSWNAGAVTRHDPRYVKALIAQAARKGMPDLDDETAELMATAIFDRSNAKLRNEGLEFFGSIGRNDTEILEAMLRDADGISEARIESIMGRLQQNLDEAGVVKYGKGRIPFDMTARIQLPDGSELAMQDLVDTDLGRLAENYLGAMTGRAALAKAGIGGDDQAINAFKRQYMDSIRELPENIRRDRALTLDGLLSDFTGLRPEGNILGQGAQRVKSMTDSTVLGASGLWQVNQYADIAHRYGMAETTKEFFKNFPGSRALFRDIGRKPDLRDELDTVLNLDLARDIRWHPWLRQHDINLASRDTAFDRVLHAGKQLTPMLNGMKYVHKHQTRMNANLALNKIAQAAAGDGSAQRLVRQYGLTGERYERVLAAARGNVTYKGRNASAMNWQAWDEGIRDEALDVALRMMDDALVYSRPGQAAGSPMMARSQIGQVLGQFRSWVSTAHNKLLRGTLHNEGATGLAALLVFQYPLTFMMVAANEARAGRFDDADIESIARRAVGYTAGLGLAAEAIGIVGLTGSRGGLNVPLTAAFDSLPRAFGGAGKMLGGDFRDGGADIMKAATSVMPGVAILPGTALAIDAVRGD